MNCFLCFSLPAFWISFSVNLVFDQVWLLPLSVTDLFSVLSLCLKACTSMQPLVFLSTSGFVLGSYQPDEVLTLPNLYATLLLVASFFCRLCSTCFYNLHLPQRHLVSSDASRKVVGCIWYYLGLSLQMLTLGIHAVLFYLKSDYVFCKQHVSDSQKHEMVKARQETILWERGQIWKVLESIFT